MWKSLFMDTIGVSLLGLGLSCFILLGIANWAFSDPPGSYSYEWVTVESYEDRRGPGESYERVFHPDWSKSTNPDWVDFLQRDGGALVLPLIALILGGVSITQAHRFENRRRLPRPVRPH